MSLSSKPQISEAIVFFDAQGQVCRQMRVPEFEAVLDGIVKLSEYQGLTMRCAYLLINSRLLVRSAVLFTLDFDAQGAADSTWNLPLRKLAEKAERGPDLGAGPIRLACRSQCPIEWHQMHLWDCYDQELQNLRPVLRRNQLGLMADEDLGTGENLQVVSEERWYTAPVAPPAFKNHERTLDAEQRKKAAVLIKWQRKRIQQLQQAHQANSYEQQEAFEQELLEVRMAHQNALQQNARHVAHIERLQRQLEAQIEESERLAQRLHDLKQQSSEQIMALSQELAQQSIE